MRRRAFITLLGGATVAWPLMARAQQPTMPIIGFLDAGSPEAFRYLVEAFTQGLSQSSYIEGKNVAIEYRWANGQYDRLPAMAAELVRRPVAVIATGAPVAALAAKAATATIPIVFSLGSDPIKDGLVASLSRPGSNITGATFFANLLDKKRLDLLHQLVPTAQMVAVLVNPNNPQADSQRNNAKDAASALRLKLILTQAGTELEIDAAFAKIVEQRATAVLIASDTFLHSQTNQIAELAIRYALPTSFAFREQAEKGGFMSYGASIANTFRQSGTYVGRILKGEKPRDLPVQQPTKFDFVINMKTARALGLNVPSSMQLLADEVIE